MNWNRTLLLMLTPAVLAACGGGGDDEPEVSPPGVIFTANGIQNPTALTVQQAEYTKDNSTYRENCDTTNAGDLTGETQYCDGKRVYGVVFFQFRFINNLLQSIPFSYTGTGVTVRIEQRTSTSPETWEIVWDSDAYLKSMAKRSGSDYDQLALGTITSLGPAEAYPHQDFTPLTFAFQTDRNFVDDNANGQYDDTADRLVALPGVVADADEDDGSSKCAWLPVLNSTTNKYDMPLCQTGSLAPGTYRATVHYNFVFNGTVADPAPVIITVTPPPAS